MRKPLFFLLLFPITFIWIIGWGLYWTGSRRNHKHHPSKRDNTAMENLEIAANIVFDEITIQLKNE